MNELVFTKAERVFKIYYSIKIAKMHTIAHTVLNEYALPQSGDPEVDAQLFESPIDMLVTPAGMAMYIAEGAHFQLNKLEDMEPVYTDVHTLLTHIAGVLNDQWSQGFKPPIKDIIALDSLCNALYPFVMQIREARGSSAAPNTVDALFEQFQMFKGLRPVISTAPVQAATPKVPYQSVTKLFTPSTWKIYGNSRYATAAAHR